MEIYDDADIQVSEGRARFIFEIPGYRLHKPIEALFFEEGTNSYRIQHTLPSVDLESGRDIIGLGKTEKSAGNHLISQLLNRYSNPKDELERNYLNSIMSRV